MIVLSPARRTEVGGPSWGSGSLARRGRLLLEVSGVFSTPSAAAVARQLCRRLPWSPGDDGVGAALRLLMRSALALEPVPAREAGKELIGRGPGLTPLGDDMVAATILARWAICARHRCDRSEIEVWLRALIPSDLRRRTTPVSAACLNEAALNRPAPPVAGVLDLEQGEESARIHARELLAVGSSTGAGYVSAVGATYLLVGSCDQHGNRRGWRH